MSIKIYHSADVQVNCAGKHSNRYNEHVYMLTQQSSTVINEGYDLAVFVGDMFERANTTDTEKSLLVNHLIKPILDAGIPIFWTDGNHDLKQSKFSFDPGDGSKKDEVGVLRALTDFIDSPLLTYGEETGFYNMGEFKGQNVIIACWSHKAKYSTEAKFKSPWLELDAKPAEKQESIRAALANSIVFDTYHDPVRNVKNFDGKVVRGDNEARTDISEFLGDFCLMGDIHMPSIMRTPNRAADFFASYPSSPMILYFGEGDYYTNFTLVDERNPHHGFNHVVVHSKTSKEVTFVPYNQHTTRHTITITEDFDVDAIPDFELKNASAINNMVRLVMTTFEGIEQVDKLIKHLQNKYTVSIDIQTKVNQTLTQNSLDESFNISDLSDKDYLMKIATQCITDKVNATRDSDEYKLRLIEDTVKVFESALDNTQYVVPLSKYKFQTLDLHNFMPINELKLDFDQIRNLGSIVKINGNNGTGKTTIYKGLLWIATGKIDWRQSENKSKRNALDYFNDKAWDKDTTAGRLVVTLNDERIEVSRSITRLWAAKTSDTHKKSVNWKHHVWRVDENLEVKVNGEVLAEKDADEKLLEVFGDFYKFQSMHVVNQAHLDHLLLNLPLDKLIDYILKSIGFTVAEQLKANLEPERSRLFKDLVKHGKDIAGINIDIGIKETEIVQTEENIADVEKQIDQATDEISKVGTMLNQLNAKLHVVSDEDKANVSKKEQIVEQMSGLQLAIKETQYKIDNPVWSEEKQQGLAALKAEQVKLNGDLLTGTSRISELQSTNVILNNTVFTASGEITNINVAHANEKAQAKSDLQKAKADNLATIANSINQILDAVNAEAKERNAEVGEKLDELNEAIRATKESKSQYESAVAKLEGQIESEQKQIDKLNSGQCQICDKSYAELPTVKAEIAKHQATIDTANANITTIKGHIEKFEATIAANEQSIVTTEALRKEVVTQLTQLTQEQLTANITQLTEIKRLTDENKDEYIQTKSDAIDKLELSEGQLARVNELKLTIADAEAKVKANNDAVETLRLSIAELPKKLENVQLEIANDEAFREANTSEALYKLLLTQKGSVESGEKLLERIVVAEKNLQDNEVVEAEIKLQESKTDEYKKALNLANSEAAKLRIRLTTLKTQKAGLESVIDEIKDYEHANNIWSMFIHTIGIKGLNKYVFDTIALQINAELNSLLDGLNYRIFFDLGDGYALKMVDLLGNASIRNLYTIGGMESTLGSLALLTVIKSKTIKNNGDFMFLDEITGKLNNSKDTKGTDATNKDYHFEFYTILKKLSQNINICIVDHALPIEWFASVIDIVKYDNGVSDIVQSV
ncbi:metallo-phosphoesterase [Chryseobacterium phage MA9V-2]|nr:metallo-phosphoesterase [Chryseobacterium phage MA9V-2]